MRAEGELRLIRVSLALVLGSFWFSASACEPPAELMLEAEASEELAVDGGVSAASAHIIYGEDNRVDVYASGSARLREIATSATAALVPYHLLQSTPTGMRLRGATLSANEHLCDDQRFREQPVNASCSATLVARDLILTAGHCVPANSSCDSSAIVFNYRMANERELAPISEADVYGCREIIARAHSSNSGLDFAFIRLDREVAPHLRPVPLRAPRGRLPEGAPLAMIGHPNGLPAKIADGARVMRSSLFDGNVFLTNLDAFSGNSGSGVFDAEGALVGVLVFGHADYRERSGGDCREVVRRDDGDGGEGVVYAYRAFDHLCERSPRVSPICESLCEGRHCAAAFTLRSECSADDPGAQVRGEVEELEKEECAAPNAWHCDPDDYGTGGACHCGCGVPDPDCLLPSRPVIGCQGEEVCSLGGECAPAEEKERSGRQGCSAAPAGLSAFPLLALAFTLFRRRASRPRFR